MHSNMIVMQTIILLCYFVASTMASALHDGHFCSREEKYTELERKNVTQPMKVRKNSWCLEKVRCWDYETQIRNIIKLENVTKTRIIQECCLGYVKVILENVTHCKSICEPGYMGENCDLPCPKGYFGEMCDSKCSCKKGVSCDSISGKCSDDLIDGINIEGIKNFKELKNSIENHKNYKLVHPYMKMDMSKAHYADSFKMYKEMEPNETMKVKLHEMVGHVDIDLMEENHYQDYLKKNKELKQKFEHIMEIVPNTKIDKKSHMSNKTQNSTDFDGMLYAIKKQATESHNIDFHEEDKAFLRFAGYVLLFMLIILALVVLYLKMLKFEEQRDAEAASQSVANMYKKPAKIVQEPLPPLPKPPLVRQKSVSFEDMIADQRPLEFRLEKLKTIPENYDVPQNNASITDIYSASSKKTKFPNTQAAVLAAQIHNNTFPRRKSTINSNLEHIYDEIHEKGSRM